MGRGSLLPNNRLHKNSYTLGWSCAILLSDASGTTLQSAAAPRLPEAYTNAINGLLIADGNGSCGTAAFRRQRIITPDVFNSPLWDKYHDLARLGGFSACFSEPILGPEEQLLGTLAAYHPQPASPSAEQLSLLLQGCQLAALIISHARSLEQLQASQKTFHGIFDSASQAFIILDEQGLIIDVNSEAERLSAYRREELLGRHYHLLSSPEMCDLDAVDRKFQAARAGQPQLLELWIQNTHGHLFPLDVHLQASRYFGRQALIASVQNISERKLTELRRDVEHRLAQHLLAETPLVTLLDSTLHDLLSYPELSAGAIHWPHADGSYTLLTHSGLSATFVAQISRIAPDTEHAKIIREGQPFCSCSSQSPLCSADSLTDQAPYRDEKLRSLLILPLKINEQTTACLMLGSRLNTQLSHSTVTVMKTLAQHLASSLGDLLARVSIRQTQQNLSGLFDSLNDFIVIVNQNGQIIAHNQAVLSKLGYETQQLLGQSISCLHPADRQPAVESTLLAMREGTTNSCPEPLQCADGSLIPVETHCVQGQWNGQPAFFGISQDITARLQAEEKQRLATSVFDNAHEGIMITDAAGCIVEVNDTFSELTGYRRDEALGHNADLLNSGHHDSAFYRDMWQTIREKSFWRGEVWNRKKNGEIFVELLTISTVRNERNEITHYVGIFSDITLQKESQQRLEHLAHYDALTQLPNRMLLGDRMQLAMAQCERSHKLLAIGYLDLDGFKPVNDQFGHATGDCLLIEVGQRLKSCVRGGDTVARLGGDEFVLLFSGLGNEHECDQAVARVLIALNQPFLIGGRHLSISASIGVTLYPTDGADADTLLRHADQAMYTAKQAGRNRSHLFDPESDRRARARRDEVERIQLALQQQEFELHYQPKVNMRQGHVVGAEALIRWRHPERGLLSPGEFLPIIEGSALAIDVGNWVLREALRQMAEWQKQGLDLQVSVNIAGEHLLHPMFTQRLRDLLKDFPSISPDRVELEILETAALDDMALATKLFDECRNLGVHFALDDFGTGYSSLTYFRRLPADMLKIDQSFVCHMLDNSEDLAIVEGVIGLTQAFQRQVIAEGVETVEHGLILLLLGCDLAQGYGIARPMPAADLPGWIQTFQPDSLWSTATSFEWSRDDLPLLIAEVDHKRWLHQLIDHLEQRTINGIVPALPPLDPHQCRFGQWYDGQATQRYQHLTAYPPLSTAHERLHQIAHHLHALFKQPGTDTASLRAELETASQEMTLLLQDIQTEIVLGNALGKASKFRH